MQVADVSTVLGDFSDTTFDYFGKQTQFSSDGDQHVVTTENADGEEKEFRVAYTFGVAPLQQYLVEFPGGRLQALPYSWDTRDEADGGRRWYHLYPDEYIGPGDELHWTGRLQNWNYLCAECHSTNLQMRYDAATASYDTTYSELSVGCEACHGPGSHHRDQAVTGSYDGNLGLQVDLDDRNGAVWIMSPDTGIAGRSEPAPDVLRQPEACGRCHSRRGVIAPHYEYGKPLTDTHLPALLDEHLYFADGQIKDEVYVYGSFVQSRMHRAGVTCSDCHNPHNGELHAGDDPSDACARCHLPSTFATVEHSRHEPSDAACVDCHMPSRTYMGVDDRRDHSFRIPRPDLSTALGSPNACNECHSDESPAWAAAQVAEWLGPGAQQRSHYGTAIAAGREGRANAALCEAANNDAYPAIARATAITLLSPPFGELEFATLRSGLSNPDPLLRIAALRALRLTATENRLRIQPMGLDDPVRSVRLEAASTYAELRDLLPVGQTRAFARAADEYRETYSMLANTPEGLANLGSFELSMGDANAALEHFSSAVKLEPRSALLRHLMGLVLVRTGDRDAALEQLRLAFELEPGNARYVYVYGVALNSLGRHDDALQVLQTAREQFPNDFDIGWAVATILRDAGDIANARIVATQLATQYPDDLNIAALLEALGR